MNLKRIYFCQLILFSILMVGITLSLIIENFALTSFTCFWAPVSIIFHVYAFARYKLIRFIGLGLISLLMFILAIFF